MIGKRWIRKPNHLRLIPRDSPLSATQIRALPCCRVRVYREKDEREVKCKLTKHHPFHGRIGLQGPPVQITRDILRITSHNETHCRIKSIDTGRQVVSPNPLAHRQAKIRYRKHSKMPCSGYLKLIQLLRECQQAPILNDQLLSATGAVDSRGSSNSKPKFSPFWVAGIPAAIHSGSGASWR